MDHMSFVRTHYPRAFARRSARCANGLQGPNSIHRARVDAARLATCHRGGTEVGKDLEDERVEPVISGGDISHILVVMGKNPRADVFPVPRDFEMDERHADGHENLDPHNEESPRSSEVVGADRTRDAADRTIELVIERLRQHKADQEQHAVERRQRRPQRCCATTTGATKEVRQQRHTIASSKRLEALASQPVVVEVPEVHQGLSASLTSMLYFVIGVLVSIATWGALPMPWSQPHLQPSAAPSRHESSRRSRCVTRRAEYLYEWELVHHSGVAWSVLEDSTLY